MSKKAPFVLGAWEVQQMLMRGEAGPAVKTEDNEGASNIKPASIFYVDAF